MSHSPLPHLLLSLTPSPIVLPSPSPHKTALIKVPRNLIFAKPSGHSLTQLTASSIGKHYLWAPRIQSLLVVLPGFPPFLPHPPPNIRGHRAGRGSLLSPIYAFPGSFKSQPRPQISLQPQPSPEHQLRESTGLFVISTCSSNRPVQKRTLNFYPPNYVSLSLDSSLSHPTPKPSTHRVSSTPKTHPDPAHFPGSSASAPVSPCLDNCSSLLPPQAP